MEETTAKATAVVSKIDNEKKWHKKPHPMCQQNSIDIEKNEIPKYDQYYKIELHTVVFI